MRERQPQEQPFVSANKFIGDPCAKCGALRRYKSNGSCASCEARRSRIKKWGDDAAKSRAIREAEKLREQIQLERELNYLEMGDI